MAILKVQLIEKPTLNTPVATYYIYSQADSGANPVYKISIADLHKFLVSTAAANSANVTFADTFAVRLGTGNDLSLSHSGTASTINNTTGALTVSNSANNQKATLSAKTATATTSLQIFPVSPAIAVVGGSLAINHETVTINNAAIHVTKIPIGNPGEIFLQNTAGGAENGALFSCNFIAGTVSRTQGSNAVYDNTKDNPGTINIYNGTTFVEIQNNRGTPRTITYGFLTAKQIT